MIPEGIPPEASVRPIPIPFSPLMITAVELRFVGAGGLAKVLGANVLTGKSRMRGNEVPGLRSVGISGIVGVGNAPGPTGIEL